MRTVMVVLALVALITMAAAASLNLVAGPDIKPWSDVKPYGVASAGESGGVRPGA